MPAAPNPSAPSSPTRHFHTSADYLRNLLTTVETMGADAEALLGAIGMQLADLDDPHARVRDDQKLAVWERAAATLADPHLGLRVGEAAPIGRWGLIEQLILQSETLGEALETSIRFAALMADGKQIHLDRLGGRVTYAIDLQSAPPRPVPAGWRHQVESDLVYTVRLVRLFVSPAFTPESVWIAHAEPAGVDRTEYTRRLGPDVQFEQATHAVHFDADWLDAPIQSAVPTLRAPLEVAAARALARLDAERTVAERVEAYIRLDPATVTLNDVAREMGMSTRTLQRRLRDEDTAFQTILDAVRRDYADALLREPAIELSEISYRLGFSEPSALYRAVKRWFGTTATEYRRSALAS